MNFHLNIQNARDFPSSSIILTKETVAFTQYRIGTILRTLTETCLSSLYISYILLQENNLFFLFPEALPNKEKKMTAIKSITQSGEYQKRNSYNQKIKHQIFNQLQETPH